MKMVLYVLRCSQGPVRYQTRDMCRPGQHAEIAPRRCPLASHARRASFDEGVASVEVFFSGDPTYFDGIAIFGWDAPRPFDHLFL